MKRLAIDFAEVSFLRCVYSAHWMTIVLCLAGFAFAGTGVYAGYISSLHDSRAMQTRIQLEQALAKINRPDKVDAVRATAAQVTAVNLAIARLNVPWHAIFEAMESSTPATIAILSLEPNVGKGLLQVRAEARDAHDMLDYVQRLQHQPLFLSTFLSSHEINERDPNRPLRFAVEVRWSEAKK